MKHGTWIVCLLLIAWCGVTHPELDILEKLRTPGWALRPDFKADAGADLILMGDAAVPFLIQTLADETPVARRHAAVFLRDLFPDARALSALTEVFLHDAYPSIRRTAAEAIACIDAEVARNLMFQHLEGSDASEAPAVRRRDLPVWMHPGSSDASEATDVPGESQYGHAVVPNQNTYADETTQDIAVDMLCQLQDKRVIPTLVRKLADRGERMDAALALAKFKDKRAVPALLDILNGKDGRDNIREAEAVEALAKIGDERAVPVLLNLLDGPRIGYLDVVSALPQLGVSVVPQLLKKLKQTESREIQARIARVLRHLHQPELAPVFGQLYLESEKEDFELQDALSYALKNMGIAGFEELVRVAQQKANYRALSALATYNSAAAVDAVAALALDKSYPLRLEAIQTLGACGKLWEAEISKYLLLLLSDAAPAVKLYTMDIIREIKLVEMAPALQELTQTDNEHLQQAAHYVLATLADEIPLRLEVKMSQPRYAYGINTVIAVSYRIMNISTFPIQCAMPRLYFLQELDIRRPDGTSAPGTGPLLHFLGPSRPEDFDTLMPNGDLTMTFHVSKSHWLDQVGRYTIRPRIHTWETGLHFGFLAWTGTLTAPDVHFEIEPPTAKQIDAMFAQVEAALSIKVFRNQGIKTLCQLAELRIPGAMPALIKLALTENLDGKADIRHRVLSALGKSASPELNPLWIQMLERGELPSCRAMETLIKSGETGAIALIRRTIYQYSVKNPFQKEIGDAALTLQRLLGDNTVFEWLRATAEHKIRHWTRYTREEGARILHSLWNPDYQLREPPNVFTDPWFYLHNATSRNLPEWEKIREKSMSFAGLEELLGHANPAIRRAAAYELAYRGNTEGMHLVKPDLHAANAETRVRARNALVRAQVQE